MHGILRVGMIALFVTILVSVQQVIAQDSATTTAIAEAEAHRQAGRFTEGQGVLETALAQQPTPDLQSQLHAALAEFHRAWSDDLKQRYLYQEAITHYEIAFSFEQHDRQKEAAATLTAIGNAYRELSRYDTARAYYEWALILQREVGDHAGEGVILSRLGQVYGDVDQNEKAVEVLEQALPYLRAAHDRRTEGQALGYLGVAYLGLSQYDRARGYYEQALAIAKEIGSRTDEAEALIHLGAERRLRGKFPAAVPYIQQALVIYREIHDRRGEARALNQLGAVFTTTNPPVGVEYYEQALPIARATHDRDLEGSLLGNLGVVSHQLGHFDKALGYLTQALTIDRELHKRYGEGANLNNLGGVHQSLGQYDTAVTYFEQALAIKQELKDRAGESAVLHGLGSVYEDLSQYDKAIVLYEQALNLARETQSRNREASVLNSLALAYLHLSQYDKALALFEQSLAIMRESGNRPAEGRILSNIGVTYRHLGRSEQAIPYMEQSLTIAREIKDRAGESATLDNLATAYVTLSQYDKAIAYNQDALILAREIKDKHGEGQALGNLGVLSFSLGQYEQARQQFEQSATILRDIKSRDNEGMALFNLGSVHRSLQQYDKAREYYEQALIIAREVRDRDGEVLRLSGLGSVHGALGKHEKAVALQEQALGLAHEIKDRRAEAMLLNNLGVRQGDAGSWEKTIPYCEQALAIVREIGDRDQEARTLHNLMWAWQKRGTPQLAIFYGKQAVNVYQEIRGRIRGLSNHLQEGFLQSKEETYRTLADLLIGQGRLPEAEDVLRLLKQEELYEFVRRDAKAVDALARVALIHDEQQWARRYQEIADRLTALGQEFAALQAKQQKVTQLSLAEDERRRALTTDLQTARKAMAVFLTELANTLNDSQAAGKRMAELDTSRNFQDMLQTLGKGTVAVFTVVGKDKSWVIVVAPAVQKAYEVPIAAADLNRKVLAFRRALQNPALDPRPLGKELYDLFVQPLANDLEVLQAQTVMWSLDGVLRYVPIAAFYDGQRYVAERYRTTVFTLASQSFLTTSPQSRWHVAGMGVSKEQPGFMALPEVPQELRAIVRAGKAAAGILPGSIQLDADFTVRALETALFRRTPVVHLASHFHFQPGNETDSFLLLGDGSKLSIAELLGYSFSGVDLLTLSACATALGSDGNGKEIESFAALAQKSGAKAVVASLWPVADASTKELMQQFYRTRAGKKGTSKAEALQQAQLALLQGKLTQGDPAQQRGVARVSHEAVNTSAPDTPPPFVKDSAKPYAHPYYWAPFILIGNWW